MVQIDLAGRGLSTILFRREGRENLLGDVSGADQSPFPFRLLTLADANEEFVVLLLSQTLQIHLSDRQRFQVLPDLFHGGLSQEADPDLGAATEIDAPVEAASE